MSQKQQEMQAFQSGGNIEKVKSGRKKKEETSRYLETPMNPYYKVYQRLMRYLDSIGLIHGLCFTAQLRKSLKQFNKFSDIQWKDSSDGWYYIQELNTLRQDKALMKRIRRLMFAIKSRCRKLRKKNSEKISSVPESNIIQHNNLSKWTLNKVIDFILRPGQMVDPECRYQMYTLNTVLLQSIFSKRLKGRNMSRENAEKFFQISRFFSRKFTNFKKKNWIEIKRCAQEDIIKLFVKMFAFFKVNYEDILYDFEEWDKYNSDMKILFQEDNIKMEGTTNEQKQQQK